MFRHTLRHIQTLLRHGRLMLKAAFTCNHAATPPSEGKCFCPQCGRGIVFEWVLLRCHQCNGHRRSRYHLRQVVPLEHSCPRCGEPAVRQHRLENPQYYQLTHARLILREEDEYIAVLQRESRLTAIRVWLDNQAGQFKTQALPAIPS